MTSSDTGGNSLLAGRYELGREIGRGGMATVYVAEDVRHERQVAVKVLHPELSASIGIDRFSREIKLAARLQHPHILSLYDSGEMNGSLFYVMPYVDGESLRERLTRLRALRLEDTARIIRQVGDALDYARARGVVHRDIKPENILLSGNQAFLADFGVAKAVGIGAADTLTSFGVTLGTPAYMSPEQATGEQDLDGRSDLYALGCLAYEMLSGSPPFSGKNAMATISQHITKPPPPLVGLLEQVPEQVGAAVRLMLAKDPDERPASAAVFATVLETAANAARLPSPSDERLGAIARAGADRKSVCVLDFANIANAADLDWLSTGIAETVTVDLRKISGIRVVGADADTRQRVAAAGKSGLLDGETARELGRSVGARWVVWGAFQKAGSRIRLTPQFGDVATGETISAEKIDGSVDEIFELQDRIVTRLAEALRIKLTSSEVEQIARPQTRDLSAYELYARGKQAFLLFGKESSETAADLFRQAIALDASYALAWAGLGSLLMPRYISTGDPRHLDEGVRALQRAMDLDPALGEPHAFLSYMYTRQHRFDDAVAAARGAIEREPEGYQGWYQLGLAHAVRGFSEGRLDDLRRAIPPLLRCRALAPGYHPQRMIAGALYLLRGQYGHAISVIDEAVEIERKGVGMLFLGSYVQRACLHQNSGEPAKARALLDLAIETYPAIDHVYSETMTAHAYFARGALWEREGDLAAARRDFESACAVAESHEHRLGIGAHWVKSRLGLARLAHRAGDHGMAGRLVDEALATRAGKTRFVWSYIMGCSEAETLYELSATHAVRGNAQAAVDALEEAVQFGWADVHQLSHDPNFAALRESDPVRQLTARAASLVTLPPPVGSGGLPD